jgi:hypothetical protein
LVLQPAGELDGSGQSAGRDDFARVLPGAGCIQPVEDESNTCGPFFSLWKSDPDPLIGLVEDGLIELTFPFIPKTTPFPV